MFCDRIKQARQAKKMMQKELAEILNVSPSTVSMWESGTRTPDLETVSKIADVLGVSYNDLLGEKMVEAVFDGKITPEHLELIKEKAPAMSRSDLGYIMSLMDEAEIDQMIDFALYLLSKRGIQVSQEDISNK